MGFPEPFSSHFLVCNAGGPLSWYLELEEVSLGLFLLAFLLVPGVTCDFFIRHYYVVLLIRIFICFNICGTKYCLKAPYTWVIYFFWGTWEVFFFSFQFLNKVRKCHGKDLLSTPSTLLSTLPSCFPSFSFKPKLCCKRCCAHRCKWLFFGYIMRYPLPQSICGVGYHWSRTSPQQ